MGSSLLHTQTHTPTRRHPQLAAYGLALAMALHVLSILFTFWSVSFNATVNYRPAASLADAEYVQVSRGMRFSVFPPLSSATVADWK